jgi:hypothetical protein
LRDFRGAALAADISGNWSGTMQMGDNPVALTFVFKQDGEKLTGTVPRLPAICR